MAKIHLVGGEKGGIGKSVVARVLAQYFIDNDMPFRAFDTDRSHGSLMRFYSDYSQAVSVDSYENLDEIVESANANPEQQILVDLAAQTFHPFMSWLDESGVLDLTHELDISVTYWHVMDAGKDSIDLLQPLYAKFHDRIHYVLVENEVHGSDFTLFEHSDSRTFVKQFQTEIVQLKRLHPPVMNKIDALSCSFWAAQQPASDASTESLGLLERQRAKIWLRNAYEALVASGELAEVQ